MKRFFLAALALIAVIGLQPQAAHAQSNNYNSWNAFWAWLSHGQDPRLTTVSIGLGAAATAASFAATTRHHGHIGDGVFVSAWAVSSAACAAAYPIVGTLVINRPLTPREAYTGIADCFVPFIGGWLVDAWLPHTAWVDGTPPPRRHWHHRHG